MTLLLSDEFSDVTEISIEFNCNVWYSGITMPLPKGLRKTVSITKTTRTREPKWVFIQLWKWSRHLLPPSHHLFSSYDPCLPSIFSLLCGESRSGLHSIHIKQYFYELDTGIWESCHFSSWSLTNRGRQRTGGVLHHSMCWYLWEDWSKDKYLWNTSSRSSCKQQKDLSSKPILLDSD